MASFIKSSIKAVTGVQDIKLIFDRKNTPYVIFFSGSYDKVISIVHRSSIKFQGVAWKFNNISKETFNANGLRDRYSSFELDDVD